MGPWRLGKHETLVFIDWVISTVSAPAWVWSGRSEKYCDSVRWGRDPGWTYLGGCWLCQKLHLGQAGEL